MGTRKSLYFPARLDFSSSPLSAPGSPRMTRVLNTNKNWRRPPQCETLPPKMFSSNGSEKDPVAVYKFSVQERPEKMIPTLRFKVTLQLTSKFSNSEKCWFKCNAVGTNKLGGLMKEMSKKAGLQNDKLRNHSARKIMVPTLSENNVHRHKSHSSPATKT